MVCYRANGIESMKVKVTLVASMRGSMSLLYKITLNTLSLNAKEAPMSHVIGGQSKKAWNI